MTVGQAIRAKCLECLCAETAHRAFDCMGASCPLYPAHPFRGKAMPQCERDAGHSEPFEARHVEKAHTIRSRRPSKVLIR